MGLSFDTWFKWGGLLALVACTGCSSDKNFIAPGDAGGGTGGRPPDRDSGTPMGGATADAGSQGGNSSGGTVAMGGRGGTSSGDPLVVCDNSLDCTGAPGGRVICDATLGLCVECASAADCPENSECRNRQCETYNPCTNSLACPQGLVCATPLSRCVECVTNADCPEDRTCSDSTCRVTCSSDNQCTPLGMLCNFAGGYCAQCIEDTDCEDNQYCDAGRCHPDRCEPDVAICTSAGIVTCAENGSALLAGVPCGARESCVTDGPEATCVPWVCTPGETECLDSTLLVECSPDGFSILGSTDCTASGQYCVGGECTATLCPAGELYCAQGEVRQCAADAQSSTLYETCLQTEYCDARNPSCQPQICTPRAPTCNGNSTTTCNARGSGYIDVGTPCPDGQYCASGVCGSSVLVDDFEDGDATDWTTYAGLPVYSTITATVVATTGASGTTQSLDLTVSNLLTPIESWASHTFTEAPVTAASFWMQPASTTTANFYLLQSGTVVMTMGISTTGVFTVSGVESGTGYVAGTWYHVELRNIDWVAHTFEVYVDGALLGQSNMDDVTATAVDEVRLGITPATSATVYFDQITIG